MNIYLFKDTMSLFFKKTLGGALLITLVTSVPLYAMEQAQVSELAATSLATIASMLTTPAAPSMEQERRTQKYVCDICDKTLSGATSLKTHKLTHTSEKPFKCDFDGCTYACTSSGNLKKHKLIHTGEKPYKCDFDGCTYACTTSSHLIRHKLNHSEKKAFKCNHPGCKYACKRSDHLKEHELKHNREKPFKCDAHGCNYACTTSGNLKRHKLRHDRKRTTPETLDQVVKRHDAKNTQQCETDTETEMESIHENQ